MDAILIYLLLFVIFLLVTFAENLFFTFKLNYLKNQFKSEIGEWHELMRNVSLSILIIKIAAGVFILLFLLELEGFMTGMHNIIAYSDLFVFFIGTLLLVITGRRFIFKTNDLVKNYGFNN